MVCSSVLYDKTLVALNALEDVRFLYGPLPNIGPFLILARVLGILLRMGWLPPGVPVICKLLNEIGFDGGGLSQAGSAFRFRRRCVFAVTPFAV
jgi:hypothetical protein